MSEHREQRSVVASLGCGTLIVIALIVFFLGRPDLDPMRDEIASLRTEVESLRTEVERTNTLLQAVAIANGVRAEPRPVLTPDPRPEPRPQPEPEPEAAPIDDDSDEAIDVQPLGDG